MHRKHHVHSPDEINHCIVINWKAPPNKLQNVSVFIIIIPNYADDNVRQTKHWIRLCERNVKYCGSYFDGRVIWWRNSYVTDEWLWFVNTIEFNRVTWFRERDNGVTAYEMASVKRHHWDKSTQIVIALKIKHMLMHSTR